MTKCIQLLAIAAILFPAKRALADDAEVFTLLVGPAISKCSTANGVEVCDFPSSVNEVISISLNNCVGIPGQSLTCAGSWQGTLSRDGYAFLSTVVVTKSISEPITSSAKPQVNAFVQYQISASTAPAWSMQAPNPVNVILGQAGSLTDSLNFTGEEFQIANSNPQISYKPTLMIAPAGGPTPGPGVSKPQVSR